MDFDIIYNQNCIEGMALLPDKCIDLVVTDPPYIISKHSNFAVGGSWNDASRKEYRKTPPKTDFGEWDKQALDLNSIFVMLNRVLKDGGTAILFYDMWKMQELKEEAESNGFKQFRLCRWDKTNPVPVNSKTNYLSNASEYFITVVKGSKPCFHSEYDKGIYTMPICSGNERTKHPTQKPILLIQQLIEKHSDPGDLVLDPFLGSGTTAVAAYNTNRHYIGYELDNQYFDICCDRLDAAERERERERNNGNDNTIYDDGESK